MLSAGRVLAQSRYVIRAPRQRVWDLLAGTIVQCLPVGSMQIVDDTTFVGVLDMKIGPFTLPMELKVCAEAIAPIDSLSTLVTARRGPLQSSMRVSFALEASGEDTAVACTASEAGGSALLRLFKGQQRRFSAAIFESIKEGLERAC